LKIINCCSSPDNNIRYTTATFALGNADLCLRSNG